MNDKVTIIGAGNAGCALAAELSLRNYKVTLYASPHHDKNLNEIKLHNLTLEGDMIGSTPVYQLTTCIETAILASSLVILAIPSFAQQEIFEKMCQYIQDEQIFISLSGNFSAFLFLNLIKTHNIKKEVFFGDLNSSLHACRVNSNGKVYVFSKKETVILSISNTSKRVIERVKNVIDRKNLIISENLLEAGFSNTNTIIHPAPILLNIGWIESTKGDFYFYKEGVSPTIANLLEQADKERLLIGSHYEMNLPSFVNIMYDFYGRKYQDILSFAQQSPVHNTIKGTPATIQTRYVLEDVPYALVPWYYLAKKAGLNVPITELLIKLASAVYGTDYFSTGRTLKDMGLDNMANGDILLWLKNKNLHEQVAA